MRLVLINEIEGFFELCLLREYLEIKFDELVVDIESRFLHELKEQEVGDIEYFSLETEVDTDQVH